MTLLRDPKLLGSDAPLNGIRCPKCAWVPELRSLWSCYCGHTWNTFLTAARCPACSFQHVLTQCFRCLVKSPHVDWYTDTLKEP